jgi:peroxiredoxin
MLADGSGDLTKALGLEFDLSGKGLGVRSKRYAMIVENGVVKTLNNEDGGGLSVSSAEEILKSL